MIRRSHPNSGSSLIEHSRSVSQGMYEISMTCLSDDYEELARYCSLWMGWLHDILKDTEAFDHHLDKRDNCPLTYHSGGGAIIACFFASLSLERNPEILKNAHLRKYIPLLVFSVVAAHHSSVKKVNIRHEHKDSLHEWMRSHDEASKTMLEKAQSSQSQKISFDEVKYKINGFLENGDKIFSAGSDADGFMLFSLLYLSRIFLGALTYADTISAIRQDNGIQEPECFNDYQEVERADFSRAHFATFSEKSELNDLRDLFQNEILENWQSLCKDKLYLLKAPTGLGKTIAVSKLLAKIHFEQGECRVYYLAPTTVILNQVADEIRDCNSDSKTTLLLHYLEKNLSSSDENISQEERERKISALDAGLVVTTYHRMVRLLSGLNKRDCSLLRGVKDSIFVLDECQTLTYFQFTILANIFAVMAKYSNTRFILMSATPQTRTVFENALQILSNPMKISIESLLPERISEIVHQAHAVNKRRSIKTFPEINSIDALAERICAYREKNPEKSLLLLLNLAGDALKLAELLSPDYCITANLRPKNIKQQLKKASGAIKAGKPVFMIATSIIQAGVDLDFDSGFIELQELRNFRQGCGRVGRNFRPDRGTCEVFAFELVGAKGQSSWFKQRFYNVTEDNEAVKLEIAIIEESLTKVKEAESLLYDDDIEQIEKGFESKIFEIQKCLAENVQHKLYGGYSHLLNDNAVAGQGIDCDNIIGYLTEALTDDDGDDFIVLFTGQEQAEALSFFSLIDKLNESNKKLLNLKDRKSFFNIFQQTQKQKEEIRSFVAPYALRRFSILQSFKNYGQSLDSVYYEEFHFYCLINGTEAIYEEDGYGWSMKQNERGESAGIQI